jgi:hypothetical protein
MWCLCSCTLVPQNQKCLTAMPCGRAVWSPLSFPGHKKRHRFGFPAYTCVLMGCHCPLGLVPVRCRVPYVVPLSPWCPCPHGAPVPMVPLSPWCPCPHGAPICGALAWCPHVLFVKLPFLFLPVSLHVPHPCSIRFSPLQKCTPLVTCLTVCPMLCPRLVPPSLCALCFASFYKTSFPCAPCYVVPLCVVSVPMFYFVISLCGALFFVPPSGASTLMCLYLAHVCGYPVSLCAPTLCCATVWFPYL